MSMLLRDAKAGNYKPSIYGLVKEAIYGYSKLPIISTIIPETIVLDISFYQAIASPGAD